MPLGGVLRAALTDHDPWRAHSDASGGADQTAAGSLDLWHAPGAGARSRGAMEAFLTTPTRHRGPGLTAFCGDVKSAFCGEGSKGGDEDKS
mmetsp:Transcript_5009/g.10077  ORF Transcript_5009/g.10077 Transcript_5009/m.10077 type:complete len:91 (-) Transcript_5009:182-454(-)